MILSSQTIRRLQPVKPFMQYKVTRKDVFHGLPLPTVDLSYGLSPMGYDIRVSERTTPTKMNKGDFRLFHSLEEFNMPNDVCANVSDKSTLIRLGLSVHNSWIDPGWRGFLTLEVTAMDRSIWILPGMPIAHIVFHRLDEPTDTPYSGKYQDQSDKPVEAV